MRRAQLAIEISLCRQKGLIMFHGTGSYPPGLKGWQRPMRLRASYPSGDHTFQSRYRKAVSWQVAAESALAAVS